MTKTLRLGLLFLVFPFLTKAQAPVSRSSSEILLDLQKLKTFGSVLYIAAHPDDENTRLLAWLANGKKVRTGYLSITRGDGGQNLIGDEQGIDLGLIRTQELLSARRIDGAEQFFTRAYDFGYSKNPEETFRFWDHDKILHDVVWVIRKFKPDVIITRFPITGEGGHGHHTASAILAGEAFDMAGDKTKFPEQLNYPGMSVWQPKRLLWNSFNFGGTNLTREDQFKIDAGDYNALLGKSYGEMAAESRSRHKSQGFGVPAQRGSSIEYFASIKGSKPTTDIFDGIEGTNEVLPKNRIFTQSVDKIIREFSYTNPENSVPALLALYTDHRDIPLYKARLLKEIIRSSAGVFMEAAATRKNNAVGDSLRIKLSLINRSSAGLVSAGVRIEDTAYNFKDLLKNQTAELATVRYLRGNRELTQPYYLKQPMSKGSFNLNRFDDLGEPEVNSFNVQYVLNFGKTMLEYSIPVVYKFTDPVKGEIYEKAVITPAANVRVIPHLLLVPIDSPQKTASLLLQANKKLDLVNVPRYAADGTPIKTENLQALNAGDRKAISVKVSATQDAATIASDNLGSQASDFKFAEREIKYDHIPAIWYTYRDSLKILRPNLKTSGNKAGYIAGAGDKIPEALQQLGYTVTQLGENDCAADNLKKFDVIVTGVRAYNVHSWLSAVHPQLMEFVNNGGTLLVQYNTNNSIGPVKAAISPYPFNISRNRITDETAAVNFLLPEHPLLNYPNKISSTDFHNWIQERSIYNAERTDANYQKILAFSDPGEQPQDGSLISTDYGKGRFTYTGLVFFRELPAGVEGAYRLFANLIAKRRN